MEFSNPFDSSAGRFFILENAASQFSLWPEHCTLPEGWQVVCEPASNEECNQWLLANWTQLQPANFAKAEVKGE